MRPHSSHVATFLNRRNFLWGAASSALLLTSCKERFRGTQNREKRLNVLTWRFYMADDTISRFEQEHDARVTIDYYASNDEIAGRLSAAPGQFDIVFPSDYMIETLLRGTQLERIDHSQIPNLVNIAPTFLNQWFDPNNDFSIPYMWGTNGFARNRNKVHDPTRSWDDLLSQRHRGKVSVLDDFRFTLGAVLKHLGLDPNTTQQGEIQKACNFLIDRRNVIRAFTQDTPKDQLISGDLWLSYAAGGDVLQAASQNPALAYELPEGGTIIYQDGMCIPKGSPHKAVAHEFINYILRPEISANITNTIFYGNPNDHAKQLIRPDILSNAAIFPSKSYIEQRCSHIHAIDEPTKLLYARLWDQVKA